MSHENTHQTGPYYAETGMEFLHLSEPLNALSSLAILLPALYWSFKLWRERKTYPFIFFCTPLLFLGGTGSLLFHGFRDYPWLIWLDVLPTALLTLAVAMYFWAKVLPKPTWLFVALVILPVTATRLLLFRYVDPPASVNLSYFVVGLTIFLPLVRLLWTTEFQHYLDILLAVFCLALALWFRERDHVWIEFFPRGTHFLWHLSSGVGAFYLARFLYKFRTVELAREKT